MEDIINIVICDDDADFTDKLERRVYKIAVANNCRCVITKLYSAKELLVYCKGNSADIILTDIDMPDVTSVKPADFFAMAGFNAAEQLQEKYPCSEIMFVSAHEELAYQSFRYRPFSFVSKRDLARLDEHLGELIRKIKIRRADNAFVQLSADNKTYSINTGEVIYFENEKHYIYACTVNGREHSYRCSIKDAYAQLKSAYFIYVHRSYLLNCRFITYFDTQIVEMCDGTKINVTRDAARLKEAQSIFARYKRSMR